MRAFEAANQEYSNAHRNQNGEDASVHCDPMAKVLHLRSTPCGPGTPALVGQVAQERSPEYLF